jgi:hypothetical protein
MLCRDIYTQSSAPQQDWTRAASPSDQVIQTGPQEATSAAASPGFSTLSQRFLQGVLSAILQRASSVLVILAY